MRTRAPAVLVGIALLFAGAQTARPAQPRQLTFAERVAYQYAIEEVYWRHRIWPKDNPGPKPPLDAVMFPAQIEKKVADYLHNLQLLAEKGQRPITSEQLQAEMNRVARDTKQPEMLREIFAALGDDPFVIAECLARPIFAKRFDAQFDNTSSESDRVKRIHNGATKSFDFAQGELPAAYKVPEISIPLACTGDTWTATSASGAPNAREWPATVWTGSEMLVWSGGSGLSTGGRYDPATDTWTATTNRSAPTTREYFTAIWTGSEMVVWGGSTSSGATNTGGRYNPASNSWTATTTADAPSARDLHTAVWTGSEMVVWGGRGYGEVFNTGGRYNPVSDSWTTTSTTNAPARRESHTAVWSGAEVIVWGGSNFKIFFDDGERYNPSTDSWTPVSIVNAPNGRGHTAVWTGSEMIVWGGYDGSTYLNTGRRYNPSSDRWTATSLNSAPSGRVVHTAIWTGVEMIVWGGYASGVGNNFLNTGGKYNPAMNTWTSTSTASAPAGRQRHTAVWTGSEMIVWGGYNGSVLSTGGRYCAQPSTPIVQRAISRKAHGSAGTFDVSLPLSGTPGVECRSSGVPNDYTIVVTFLANVSVNGNPQAAVSSGIGTIGSGGVSNGGTVTISGNVVTIPLTNVADAQTISVTLGGVNGSTNVAVPMSILVGDTNANGAVNSGDVAQTKARLGQAVDATNFRCDVNANGAINAGDVSQIKSLLGTGLP